MRQTSGGTIACAGGAGSRSEVAPDPVVSRALAALCFDSGRARLREIGLGPEAFEDREAGDIAAVLVLGREFTGLEEEELLLREHAWGWPKGRNNWKREIEGWTVTEESAPRVIDRFASWSAVRWLPAVLRAAAGRIERGQAMAVPDVQLVRAGLEEVERVLGWVRGADGGAESEKWKAKSEHQERET